MYAYDKEFRAHIFQDEIGELSCSRHGPCASKIIIFLADKDLTRVAQVKVVSMKFVRDLIKGCVQQVGHASMNTSA